MSDHHDILTQFFWHHYLILNTYTKFIGISTKEFTLVNKAILSYGMSSEHKDVFTSKAVAKCHHTIQIYLLLHDVHQLQH